MRARGEGGGGGVSGAVNVSRARANEHEDLGENVALWHVRYVTGYCRVFFCLLCWHFLLLIILGKQSPVSRFVYLLRLRPCSVNPICCWSFGVTLPPFICCNLGVVS